MRKIWYLDSQQPNTTIFTRTNGSALYPYNPYLPLAKAFVPCIASLWAKLVARAFWSRRGSLSPGAPSGRQVAPDLSFLAALALWTRWTGRGGGSQQRPVVAARSPPPPPRRARHTRACRGPESGGASCLLSSGTAAIGSTRRPRVPRRTQLRVGHHGGAGTRWVLARRPRGLVPRYRERLSACTS